jgi:drug/metabolite transporter (DMT)-like permease
MQSIKKQAILMGLAASLFFSVTFVLNRLMSLQGGSWIWSSALRFYWMLPLFIIIVGYKGGLGVLFREIKKNAAQWLMWSTVGFGLFYAPLTFAAAYTPSWLLASTWQITIVAGIIIAPFINRNTTAVRPDYRKSALFSGVILLGIIMMQIKQAQTLHVTGIVNSVLPILIAAFAYPLGNRKMMQLTNGRLNAFQRVLGMIVCSLPFWVLLSVYEITVKHSYPATDQYIQTLVVAVFSGVLATVLYFTATDKTRSSQRQLAAVEATQSAEVVFALLGEVLLLGSPLPDAYGITGIILVILGMLLHSFKA